MIFLTATPVFAITRCIWQGPFATPARLATLREAGITHLLNVSDARSVLKLHDGPFVELVDLPIEDLVRVPDDVAIECLNTLHRLVLISNSRVYVHCTAGWNRSPTVVWMYLVACGIELDEATAIIGHRNLDAVPKHPRLVDDRLISLIVRHGARFQPHPRREALLAS